MTEKTNIFFRANVGLLEQFLLYLWKNPIQIKERFIYTKGRFFVVDFLLNKDETIRMKARIELKKENLVIRLKYSSHIKQNFLKEECSLLLSFFYQCPEELELCNQYGLYKKEDLKELETIKNPDSIYQYQQEKNLLQGEFYIFNMSKIENHCQDKVLDQILQDFNQAIQSYYK